MGFDNFFSGIYGKNIAVLGIGISNMPLIRLLVKYGAIVTAYDKKELGALLPNIRDELFFLNVPTVLGVDYLSHLTGDYIFRTPGMRPDLPEITATVAHGAILTSEMELFFDLCPCPIIAITGSDGKTTTTTIISEILKHAGHTVHIGGNIGTPLLSFCPDVSPTDYAVIELSSFQLMTMKSHAHIAVITNISPNHLDVHRDMAEYIVAKENIFMYQGVQDLLVLNAACPYTAQQAEKAPGTVRIFSPYAALKDGVYLEHNTIYFSQNGDSQPVLDTADILIPGAHNAENYMAAIAALWGIVPIESIRYVARNFSGVPHRAELVREIDGVRYYNDSIASSPTRTIAGLKAFSKPVILIAGGSDKNIPFDELGREIVCRVKCLILVGATSQKIENCVKSSPNYNSENLPIFRCNTLRDAVMAAKDAALPGDVVTMSPACASFDMYRNFEERGNLFKAQINLL